MPNENKKVKKDITFLPDRASVKDTLTSRMERG